jgi:hypothetical protein
LAPKARRIPVLFNNCQARRHSQLYPAGAFYDLNEYGAQANMATDLQSGQHCCVATPTENGDIEFAWYRYTRTERLPDPDETGEQVRVLFGEWLGSETLPKAEAVETEPYSGFFNVHGHFKQWSAIQPEGECLAPTGLRRG